MQIFEDTYFQWLFSFFAPRLSVGLPLIVTFSLSQIVVFPGCVKIFLFLRLFGLVPKIA